MQRCPICGITYEEQDAQQEFTQAQFRLLYARWKQCNHPNEPAPGLPVTDEYRVHYALWLYQNDSSKEPKVPAIRRAAQKTGVDYDQVAKAVNYANKA